MSRLELAAVSAPPLTGVSLSIDPGMTVCLGRPEDGASALVALAAGARAPRSGRVRVVGTDPRRTPLARRRIGAVLELEELPGRRVQDAVATALRLHGAAADPGAALARIGIGSWGPRRIDQLTIRERRSVALGIALALPEPALLALFEPLAYMPGVDRAETRRLLSEAALAGTIVLCATASVRDALELGGTLLVLSQGRVVRQLAQATALDLAPASSGALLVRAEPARDLVAALANRAAITAVEWNEREAPGQLVVRGNDLEAASQTVVQAARLAGVRVHALMPMVPEESAVRATGAALARAAYEEAYRLATERAIARARPAAEPPAAAPPPGPEGGAPT